MTLEIKSNEPLKDHSFYRIGGPAQHFCEPQNAEEAREALDFALKNRLQVFVLGNGSNVLFADQGFAGLVIRMKNQTWEVKEKARAVNLTVGGGVSLGKVVMQAAQNGWAGLSWAAGLPATVGGATANNAGAHGGEMSSAVEKVEVMEMNFDPKSGALMSYTSRILNHQDCEYAYRTSIFKRQKHFLIMSVTLALSIGEPAELQTEVKSILQARAAHQPLNWPSLGSTFKNPAFGEMEAEKLFAKLPEARAVFRDGKMPAGFLIEAAGLKGKRIGGVQSCEKHANFLVNLGDAQAEDVIILIGIIKQKVRDQFGVQLEEEIEYVGF